MKKWKKFDLKQIDWRPLIRSRWFWFTIVSVLSLAAALGPALRAAHVEPSEVIRDV